MRSRAHLRRFDGMIRCLLSYRVLLFALTSATLGLAACRRSVSADDLDAALTQHPEILYRVIERHPAEVIAALNKAAQVSQVATQQNAVRLAAEKTEAEFASPKVPSLDRRIAFGNPRAPITIVEYSDFQCPYCRRERDVLVEVMKRYGDTVRLIVKQTPLEMHPHAMKAALMYEAVAKQDPKLAFKLYDELFNNQERLDAKGQAYLDEAVTRVGADLARAKADAQREGIRAVVKADLDEFTRFGYTGTPGFLINGVSLEGSHSAETFERIIDRHLARIKGAVAAPAVSPAR